MDALIIISILRQIKASSSFLTSADCQVAEFLSSEHFSFFMETFRARKLFFQFRGCSAFLFKQLGAYLFSFTRVQLRSASPISVRPRQRPSRFQNLPDIALHVFEIGRGCLMLVSTRRALGVLLYSSVFFLFYSQLTVRIVHPKQDSESQSPRFACGATTSIYLSFSDAVRASAPKNAF